MHPKEYFLEKLVEESIIKSRTKILEFGSGQSRAIITILEKFPNVTYVGVEPSKKDADIARELLKSFKNVKILNRHAYGVIEGTGEFDLCFSLSVLEHIKQLGRFLSNSILSVKEGGYVIHGYDLGHSLYPGSIKERFQTFLGDNAPWILPEHKFVRYINKKNVIDFLIKNGVSIEKVTYAQMPNHKTFLEHFKTDNGRKENLAKKILDWEYEVSEFLPEMGTAQIERLFPTVTIWSKKTKFKE